MGNIVSTSARAFVLYLCVLSTAAWAGADDTAQQQIRTLISSTYDKPGQPVETSPIAVADDYAVADWSQGQRGGRALLHRIDGQWKIMACGADDLKKTTTLTEAGISSTTANHLVSQLTTAEKSVSPLRLKSFSLFGTKDDPANAEHHHAH